MKISIDTKEDSHEEIRKVIKMLQNLVGDSQEAFTNQPSSETSATATEVAFNNIFGDTNNSSQDTSTPAQTTQETKEAQAEETEQSTEDLFAELFSEEELKKMDTAEIKKDDEELPKTKGKKYDIEFY